MWPKAIAGVLILLTVVGGRLWWTGSFTTEQIPGSSVTAAPATAPSPRNAILEPGRQDSTLPAPELVNRWTESGAEPAGFAPSRGLSVSISEAPALLPERFSRLGISARPVTLDRQRLMNAPIGSTISIEVPGAAEPYQFVFDRRQRRGQRLLLSAHLAGGEPAFGLIVTLGDNLQATLSTPTGTWQIESAAGATWLTSEAELSMLADTSQPDYLIPAINRGAAP